jgi:hypothetical protein
MEEMKLYWDRQSFNNCWDDAGWFLSYHMDQGHGISIEIRGVEDASLDRLAEEVCHAMTRPRFPHTTARVVVYRGDDPIEQILIAEGDVISMGPIELSK